MEYSQYVKAIQIILEEELLEEIDRERRDARMNRSAFFREAVRAYIARRKMLEEEKRHQRGYEKHPPDEFAVWNQVAVWEED